MFTIRHNNMQLKLAIVALMAAFTLAFGSMVRAQPVSTLQVHASSSIESAWMAMQQGDFKHAIHLNKRALRGNLSTAQRVIAYNNLCVSLHMEGQLLAATEACTSAIQLDRNYWQAYNNRANVAFDSEDYVLAERDYDAALRLQPGEDAIVTNLKLVRQLSASLD